MFCQFGNEIGGNCARIGTLTWRGTLSPRTTPYFRDTLKGLAATMGGEREQPHMANHHDG